MSDYYWKKQGGQHDDAAREIQLSFYEKSPLQEEPAAPKEDAACLADVYWPALGEPAPNAAADQNLQRQNGAGEPAAPDATPGPTPAPTPVVRADEHLSSDEIDTTEPKPVVDAERGAGIVARAVGAPLTAGHLCSDEDITANTEEEESLLAGPTSNKPPGDRSSELPRANKDTVDPTKKIVCIRIGAMWVSLAHHQEDARRPLACIPNAAALQGQNGAGEQAAPDAVVGQNLQGQNGVGESTAPDAATGQNGAEEPAAPAVDMAAAGDGATDQNLQGQNGGGEPAAPDAVLGQNGAGELVEPDADMAAVGDGNRRYHPGRRGLCVACNEEGAYRE